MGVDFGGRPDMLLDDGDDGQDFEPERYATTSPGLKMQDENHPRRPRRDKERGEGNISIS